MEKSDALAALASLAHDRRIEVFRLLVRAGPAGMAAGDIAQDLGMLPNTLSNNLTILTSAGMIRSLREGRSIRYFARMETMRGLLSYLMEDCCGGRADLCHPVLGKIACAC